MSPSANASERCSLSSSSWRHHGTRLLIAFGLLIGTMTVSQLAAGASVAAGGCSDPAAGSGLSASQLNAVAGLKASELANDPALRAELARADALSAPNIALKEKRRAATLARADAGTGGLTMDQACGALGAKRGSLLQRFQNTLGTVAAASGSISYGNNWAWLNNLNQQNQTKSYYCGPAAVSEASYSMNAPAASQGTVATPMHTDQNGQTYAGDELNGTNQFVGSRTHPVVNSGRISGTVLLPTYDMTGRLSLVMPGRCREGPILKDIQTSKSVTTSSSAAIVATKAPCWFTTRTLPTACTQRLPLGSGPKPCLPISGSTTQN